MTTPQPGRRRVVACGPHLFALVNGRRVWLTPPPPDQLDDALANDPTDPGTNGRP